MTSRSSAGGVFPRPGDAQRLLAGLPAGVTPVGPQGRPTVALDGPPENTHSRL